MELGAGLVFFYEAAAHGRDDLAELVTGDAQLAACVSERVRSCSSSAGRFISRMGWQ